MNETLTIHISNFGFAASIVKKFMRTDGFVEYYAEVYDAAMGMTDEDLACNSCNFFRDMDEAYTIAEEDYARRMGASYACEIANRAVEAWRNKTN